MTQPEDDQKRGALQCLGRTVDGKNYFHEFHRSPFASMSPPPQKGESRK